MAEAQASPSHPAHSPPHPRDPLAWVLALTGLFALLTGWRLAIPSIPYFDEVHYLPAAREILSLFTEGQGAYLNREHPLLAKLLIALSMGVFGDNPLGWRIMPWLCGMLAYFAAVRTLWYASADRFATLAFAVLLATGFHLFIHARIAMLDMVMVAGLCVAAWQFVGACAQPETGRRRLALTGIAIGCALGAKWNAIPLAIVPGLTFFIARALAGRRRLLLSRRGAPVPGITLVEAFVWLGIVPLVVYALTFLPGYWLAEYLRPSPLAEKGLIGFHRDIFALQSQLMTPHRYMSTWPQWVLNLRGIWYLYEPIDGAQRGVLLIGNPLTMWLGLPALLWCLARGVWVRDWARLGAVIGYGASLGLWLIAPKPVQFYYHYFVPSFFLLAALALACSDLRRLPRGRWLAWAIPAASAAVFAWFFPIIAALPLARADAYVAWMWLDGWR
ncbi:dolichyl-phosphate-mannose--protein O-mannosyl transferase [Erythromicrobium ramosum]|uniref:Polyprenol-phosphate-mannose--protein mannosyltransferase n=1 Tax=Erythrobacter ramosus TaxID=35811 RepID=A0A6I4ULC2_9SPHN|nr:phospholipid carrier-dependent glycosyltransferase [Erythrobacter ramosus]MBB3775655.1 dolichyl-phosphate-mannose--protein O-mannosyl transferase [Erythrobacter ramosus]MXP39246.1 phospholipid carrier-dependent glycosyltransferase [Erythrobacter ramosus]